MVIVYVYSWMKQCSQGSRNASIHCADSSDMINILLSHAYIYIKFMFVVFIIKVTSCEQLSRFIARNSAKFLVMKFNKWV
jgi:hypothetical protein